MTAEKTQRGVGVAGMRERAMLAGGNLEVMSEKGEGCHVLFKVPISQDTEEIG